MAKVQLTICYGKEFTMALWIEEADLPVKHRLWGDELLIEHLTSKEVIKFNLATLRGWYQKEWTELSHRLVGTIKLLSRKDAALVVQAGEYGSLGTIHGEYTATELTRYG